MLIEKKSYSCIRVMKVETTNLTSQPLCLEVVGIRTREIAVQVRDQNLHTTNRQKDSEARRSKSYPDDNMLM